METAKAIRSPAFKSAFASAHPLMEAAGDLIMAWMLLWRASVAVPALAKRIAGKDLEEKLATDKTAAFYHGKIMAAEFFIKTQLPVTMGKLDAIQAAENPAVKIHENAF